MDLNIDEELESLQSLATSELRQRYAEDFRKDQSPVRSASAGTRNRDHPGTQGTDS